MKKIAMILPVAALLAASPAYAQGIGISPRVEVKVGYNELDAELRLNDSAFMDDADGDAIGFGVEAGVDANVTERILVGVYAGYDFPRIKECGEVFGDDEACVRNKRNWNLGARAGISVGEGGLVYVKGGFSKTKLRVSYTEASAFVRPAPFSDSDSTSGLHIGGGFEVPVSGGVYVKGEYVHTRYKDVFEDSFAPTDRADPSRNQIMGGIGFRFGGTE